MKVKRVFLVATASVIAAVAVSSCVYQPYPSHSSGYGYGYGSRNFSTVHFIKTSSPRWGYDPYTRCYYDYTRRCYYDPYLNGYYPVGYRPIYVQGAPHPHGWRSGRTYIAPPSRIYDQRLHNYQNRTEQYRSLNTDWSRNIKTTAAPSGYYNNSNRYDSRYSRDQNRDSGFDSIFGTSSSRQRSQSDSRDTNIYVSSDRERKAYDSRSSRMSEPKQEVQRLTRPERREKEERSSHPNRESNPGREKRERKDDDDQSGAMRQPEMRESSRSRSHEDRSSRPASDGGLRMVQNVE